MKKSYVKPFAEIIQFRPKESIMDYDLGDDEDFGFTESVPDEW